MGTIGVVSEQDPTNGRCSRCGRKSEDVTTPELGNWIVHEGGILVCSGCSSDADKAAAGPETFGRQERVENRQLSAHVRQLQSGLLDEPRA